MTLDYHAALDALGRRGRFGIHLGLGRTRALLHELGDPHLGIRGALIGGTNGKGSVLALVAACVREAGLRAGETPKPHLVTYRERLQIAGRLVEPADFARLVDAAIVASDRVARRHGPPTEFEVLTAVAFAWFAEEHVDLALVEVGLGGRLDATHTWDGGVAAITNVQLDHMDRLGSTIGAIAREKAAIIMRGDLAVTGATGEALDVIRRRAARLQATLDVVEPARLVALDRDGITVELRSTGEARIGLRGRHQAANAAVADAVLDSLEAAGIASVGIEARRRGYARARWPGRLELVVGPDGAEVLLDGAHNPAGAGVLADAIDDLRPHLRGGTATPRTPVTLVLAMMADKDVPGVVAALARAESFGSARIICTQVEGPRALPAADLAAAWLFGAGGDHVGRRMLVAEPDLDRALDLAMSEAEGPVVIAGSLYLVGDARRRLVSDPALADPPRPAAKSPTGAG